MRQRYLIFLAIGIQILFYISALKLHVLDYFFPWGNVHQYQGIDFYQVPNGAHAFLQGGKLTGEGAAPLAYGNFNVYHPFFTLVVGGLLQLLEPQKAFIMWLFIHAIVSIIIAVIFYLRFKTNKNFALAFFIFFALFPHYLEIWNGQYHFLLDTTIFFILLSALQKKEKLYAGISYAASLLVKPVLLLWIYPLIFHKRLKTICIGIGIFILATVPFLISGEGWYYVSNLFTRVKEPIGGPPGVFTLGALLKYFAVPMTLIAVIKVITAISIGYIQYKKRINLSMSLFIWTSFYLLFYDLVFEYHYTTLAPFLALGILTQKAFQTWFVKILSLTYVLPTPFFLFHYFQVGAVGQEVQGWAWVILVLFRIVPLILINYTCLTARYETLQPEKH